MKTLAEIQQALKAPKGQTNAFGKYKYRSCEDILESLKPLLGSFSLIVSDEIVLIGERYYIKATATLSDGKVTHQAFGYARESLDKKGMDVAQITGATSSYARKYALNGLFAIDDTKDADATNDHKEVKATPPSLAPTLALIKKVKSEDEASLVDFMSDKGLTGRDVLELNEKGLKDLFADIKKVFEV